MPKLSDRVAKAAAAAEAVEGAREFELVPPGKYLGELFDIEERMSQAKPDTGKPETEMWALSWGNITGLDGTEYPGRLFMNLNLPIGMAVPAWYRPTDKKREEKWVASQNLSLGQLKTLFEGVGYTLDSDTEELLGSVYLLTVGVETQQVGRRAGQKVNTVRGFQGPPKDGEVANLVSANRDDDEF